jgi:hypothetical protein
MNTLDELLRVHRTIMTIAKLVVIAKNLRPAASLLLLQCAAGEIAPG